ncbi:MAG: efflux RND transporter permease subunit, partial [Chloracidobacterium sp.]
MIELPNLALRYRVAVLAATLLLIGVGIWAFQNLKVEAYPDISDTGVVVITQFPGNAAEEVEQQVTIPIERALNNTPNVIARRSRTIFGLSVVELTFDDGVDDYFARQLVLERLRDAELPEGVQPGLGPLTSGIGEMYRYRLDGPQVSEMKLRELQDWVVLPRLLQVPGVADVATFGGLVKTYLVELDPLKLEKFALTAKQVADAISANNRNAGGGIVDNQQQSLVVRGVGLVRSRQDIERIVIGAFDGVPLFVRDVARVSVAPALQTGIFGYDDVAGGVEGIVLLRRWENPSDTLTALKAAIAELNAQLAPQGVQLVTVYDRGELVTNTLRTVSRTLLEGLIIVTLVLFFFLGDVR